MAFDLEIFNTQTQIAMTEYIDQDVEKFNEASQGTIVLINNPTAGDFDIRASFKQISGLVRRRNAKGTGTVAAKRLEQLLNVAVKVAAGTPPIEYEKQQYLWIQQNPELAAAMIGEQLGKARIADMLNASTLSASAAIGGNAAAVEGDGTQDISFVGLNNGGAKFGDRSASIRAWVMHSGFATKLVNAALSNSSNLFTYDNVNVVRDPLGRVFVITDSPSLMVPGATPTYKALGLVEDAIVVSDNADFNAVMIPGTGNENIKYTYQAEWTYNVGLKGYKWDMSAGGSSPTDAAIGTGTNWVQTATSIKDTAGVMVHAK